MSSSASDTMKILFVSMEVDPFIKAGGLADVARALPLAYEKMGHDARVVMPLHHMPRRDEFDLKEVVKKTSVQMDGERINFGVYESTIDGKVPVYFIDNKGFFETRKAVYGYIDDAQRFAFFSRAVLKVPEVLEWSPDIVHSNDWHSGLVPNYLKTLYAGDGLYEGTRSVFSIHNLAYQGTFNRLTLHPDEVDSGGELPPYGTPQFSTVNFMKRGILYADQVTTVSEQYAKEITTPEFGEGLDMVLRERRMKLTGIVNGVDYDKFNPETDPIIARQYSSRSTGRKSENKLALQAEMGLTEDASIPMIGIASRFASQKGFELILEVMEYLMRMNVQFAIVGEGEEKYHDAFHHYMQKHPKKFAAHMKFNSDIAQKIYAASDMYLMPSSHEPCGLSQLIALRYGSVPIVRATGGLIDTIDDFSPETREGNGFVFEEFDSMEMFAAIVRALETYRYEDVWGDLVKDVMKLEFSWERAAENYVEVYRKALGG